MRERAAIFGERGRLETGFELDHGYWLRAVRVAVNNC
jgi:hypothetical protein